jgi:diacylglycerol kinase family enzyme
VDAPRDRRRGLVPAGPFLLVNPRSGDGSPTVDELVAGAREKGVDTELLHEGADAAELARAALERGATVLGVAGGDGTLADVAQVAIEAEAPFVAVPFGTRNHFARDAGYDRDDPLAALDAFTDEVERDVDVGVVCGRLFLNNVSLGVYAAFVHDADQRTKNRVLAGLRMIPAVFGRSRRPLDLSFDVDGTRQHHRALVVLVANNDYGFETLADLEGRERLDEGRLHAYVIEAAKRRTLLALLWRVLRGRADRAAGWVEYAAESFRVEFHRSRLQAAIDGEPVELEPPFDFEVRAGALRLLLPKTSSSRDEREAAGARQ